MHHTLKRLWSITVLNKFILGSICNDILLNGNAKLPAIMHENYQSNGPPTQHPGRETDHLYISLQK